MWVEDMKATHDIFLIKENEIKGYLPRVLTLLILELWDSCNFVKSAFFFSFVATEISAVLAYWSAHNWRDLLKNTELIRLVV